MLASYSTMKTADTLPINKMKRQNSQNLRISEFLPQRWVMNEIPGFKNLDYRIVALHSHWLAADAVKQAMKAYGKQIELEPPIVPNLPPELTKIATLSSLFEVQKVYYALLFVVIEGYSDLGLKDERLDELLADSEKVALLRRNRPVTALAHADFLARGFRFHCLARAATANLRSSTGAIAGSKSAGHHSLVSS